MSNVFNIKESMSSEEKDLLDKRTNNVKCILRDKKGFEKRMKIASFVPVIRIPSPPALSTLLNEQDDIKITEVEDLIFKFSH